MEYRGLGDIYDDDFMDLDLDDNTNKQQLIGNGYQGYNDFQPQPYYQQPMQTPAQESDDDDDFDVDSLLNTEMFEEKKPKVRRKKKVMEPRVYVSPLNRKRGVTKRNAEYLTRDQRACYNHLLMVSNIESYIKQWKIKSQRVFIMEQLVRKTSGVRCYYAGLSKKLYGLPVVAIGVVVVDINQGGIDVIHFLKCHPFELDKKYLNAEVMKYLTSRRRPKNRKFTGGKPVTRFKQLFNEDKIVWSPRVSLFGRK